MVVRLFPIFCINACFVGCGSMSAPENNLEFKPVTDLSSLEGVYKNKGDPDDYMSAILWGVDRVPEKYPDTKHEEVEYIEVIASKTELKVKAIRNGCSIFDKKYVIDRDFKMSHGKIVLHKEFHALSRGGDDPILGPSYYKIEIGLDSAGHGKYQTRGFIAGLVFLIFPGAVISDHSVRFERIHSDPVGFEDCKP